MTPTRRSAIDPFSVGAAAAVAVITVAYPLAGVALAVLAFWWFSKGVARDDDGNA